MSPADARTTATTPVVNGERLLARLDELAAIGATPNGGVTREAFGPLDVRARSLVAGWMADAGLEATVDAAANLVGRRAGRNRSGRVLAAGSHLDTVVDAGALDGAYGVVAAVEVADALGRAGGLEHGITVVAFANEEGARGTSGMVGSRALVEEVPAAELATLDDEGVPLRQRLVDAGGDPDALAGARWDTAAVDAFVELHIEQGPVLDRSGTVLGAVAGITGRQAVDIELRGQANHAGTTPMDLRHDALVAGAEVILALEALARDGAVRVATCGHVLVRPNVRNVVPGATLLSAELRDHDPERLAAAGARLAQLVEEVAARRGVTATVTWGQLLTPVSSSPAVLGAVREAAERTGQPWTELWSGAGHDAQILGRRVPMAMIFVPSAGGVSHSPRERTEPEHLVAGAQLLADTLVALDTVDAPAGGRP